jgi:hypothetical protein
MNPMVRDRLRSPAMQPLRYPRYRLALGISTLAWTALWLCNIAVVAGMLQAGRTSAEIGLFQGFWTLGVPLSVIAGGLVTDRFGPHPLRIGLGLELAGIADGGVRGRRGPAAAVAAAGGDAHRLIHGMTNVGINVLAGGVVLRDLMASAIGMLLGPATGRTVGGTVAGPAVNAFGASAGSCCARCWSWRPRAQPRGRGRVQLAPTGWAAPTLTCVAGRACEPGHARCTRGAAHRGVDGGPGLRLLLLPRSWVRR